MCVRASMIVCTYNHVCDCALIICLNVVSRPKHLREHGDGM